MCAASRTGRTRRRAPPPCHEARGRRVADARHRLNGRASGASIATALALIAIKLWAQLQTGAVSVPASLADSAVDLLMAIGALWAIRYAARPPDEDHLFGHSSAEDIAALARSAVVVAIAGLVFAGGALRLPRPEPLRAEGAGLVAMGLSLALVAFRARVARRTGSKVVLADRAHYLADVAPTVGAIVALAASLVADAPCSTRCSRCSRRSGSRGWGCARRRRPSTS